MNIEMIFGYLFKLAIKNFSTDLRDDFKTIDLKTVTPKLELTSEGFELVFQANEAEWKVSLEKRYGNCLFIEVFVPYTEQTIPCFYGDQVSFILKAEAEVMYDKIVDHLLAA